MVMDPVGRVSASALAAATVLAVTNIDDPSTELNARVGGTNGALCIVTQNVVGINAWTIYCFDSSSSGSVNAPYVVAASGSGQWIAVAGRYVNSALSINGAVTLARTTGTTLVVSSTQASTSPSTGAGTVAGGFGVSGKLSVGGGVNCSTGDFDLNGSGARLIFSTNGISADPASGDDAAVIIARTDGTGSGIYANAGSVFYRPRVSAVAGRSSHYFYTGSPTTLRLKIDETGLVTLSDAVNIAVNTGTGTKIGTATGQKIGFWNATPVVQPASANQAALTDSTGGTASTTFAAITAGAGYLQADMTAVKNALAQVVLSYNAIRTALVNTGIIKGSA